MSPMMTSKNGYNERGWKHPLSFFFEKIFKKVLTNAVLCDIIRYQIKRGRSADRRGKKMKINKVIITKKEKEEIEKYLDTDPCGAFECGRIDCDSCPFKKLIDDLEDVRYRFRRMLIEEVGVEEQDD